MEQPAIRSTDWRLASRSWSGRSPSGPVSGGAFNPAVGLGVTVMGLADIMHLIVYLIADFLGGAAAAFLFKAFDMGGDKAAA